MSLATETVVAVGANALGVGAGIYGLTRGWKLVRSFVLDADEAPYEGRHERWAAAAAASRVTAHVGAPAGGVQAVDSRLEWDPVVTVHMDRHGLPHTPPPYGSWHQHRIGSDARS